MEPSPGLDQSAVLSWILTDSRDDAARAASTRGDGIDRRSAPVFLVGCHRSGTTLVRYLLDAHPAFACPPESKFIAGIEAFLTYPQSLRGLVTLGVSPEKMLAALAALIARVFDEYTRERGKRRWVDKTPNYARLLPLIDRLFGYECLYLFLIRHPLDTIDSLKRFPPFSLADPEDPDVAATIHAHGRDGVAWAYHWRDVNERLSAFSGELPGRSLLFKYEDLVADPSAVAARILAFLGEEPTDDLVERAFGRRRERGFQDPTIRDARTVHRSRLGKWKHWPRAEAARLWEVVAPVAEGLGYALEAD